jgi:predicted RNase H-like nuclease (RuvC/YqgF family)
MSGILKGFAIAAGTRLASSAVLSRPRTPASAAISQEERLSERPDPETPATNPVNIDYDRHLKAYGAEIQALWVDVNENDRRIAAQMEFVERRFREVSDEILQPRPEVDEKMFERIANLERTLLDQSISLGALRERVEAADQNMQRLIGAIERLCERTPSGSIELAQPEPSGVPDPFQAQVSFQAQLNDAMRRPNEPPATSREIRPRVA